MPRIGSGHPALALPKSNTQRVRDREGRQRQQARTNLLRYVFRRDGYQCRACGQRKALHGHELLPRSLGGDPLDPHNVVALCAECHLHGVHQKRLVIVGTDAETELLFKRVR